jgi:hypothetical protein
MELQQTTYNTYTEVIDAVQDIDERVGNMQKKVTVTPKGDSQLYIYLPLEKMDSVLEVLSHCRARIIQESNRSNDIVLNVVMGTSSTGTVYAENYEEETTTGKPFQSL